MNISRSILIFLSLLGTIKATAQGFYQTYPTAYSAQDVVQTDDGGYFAACNVAVDTSLYLLRVNNAGQTVWATNTHLNHAQSLACSKADDGGFAVLADFYADTNGYKNVVLKLNAAGVVQWTRVVGNPWLPNGLRDIVTTADGGFLLAGDTRDSSFNFQNWLVKLTPNGSIAWQKTYGSFHSTSSIVALSTGNFAISGGRNGGDLSLAVVTPAGDLVWEQVYTKPTYQRAYGLLATTDGAIAMLGTTQNATTNRLDVCILKVDGNGNELWFNHTYPYPTTQSQVFFFINDFAQDLAGNYYIPISDTNERLEFLKMDTDGNALWKRETQVNGISKAITHTVDNYFAIAGGSSAFLLKIDGEAEIYNNKISGTVFRDTDADCLFGSGEQGAPNFIVKAQGAGGTLFFKKTNNDGTYEIRVPEGDYDLLASPAFGPPGLTVTCDTLHVSIAGFNQIVTDQMIGVESLAECAMLDVEIASSLLRRCMTTRYTVSWCNYGNLTAENAYIEVTADTTLQFVASEIPVTAQNGNVYTFNIPDVPVGECSSFYVDFKVNCSVSLGNVICVEAHGYPDTTCIPPNMAWDGSELEVTGKCDNDILSFKIKNSGIAAMSQSLDYVIIEDHIMYLQGPIQLGAGHDTTIVISNPTGACYLGKILGNYSGASIIKRPTAVVENCITGGNLALALLFETGENNYAVSTTCGAVIGAIDPNDKVGYPLGWKDEHFLESNQDIEYVIRFQNTGNDTAFLVVVRDTLPTGTLDPSSLRPVAASHAYTWDVSASGMATFTFANILLPDSTTNEPASHGFIRFRVRQQPDLTDGTLIKNTAAIYFDFNDPVVTNEYFHTIGEAVFVATKTPGAQLLDFQVLPNPFKGEASFVLKNYTPKSDVRFQLFDAQGRTVQTAFFTGDTFHFNNPGLEAGIYFFSMEESGKLLTTGKVAVSK